MAPSRVLQAQYLKTVLCMGEQYLSAVLVKYPGSQWHVTNSDGAAQHSGLNGAAIPAHQGTSGSVLKDCTLYGRTVLKRSTCEVP
jgi:hypothetical protein